MKTLRKFSLFLLFSFIFLYLFGWHFSLVQVSSLNLMPGLKLLLFFKVWQCAVLSAVLTGLVAWLSALVRDRKTARRVFFAAAVFIFAFDGLFIRILDWGVIYFAGQHVDNEFWYHAFYSDGTSFLLTKAAGVIFLSGIVCLCLFIKAFRFTVSFVSETRDKKKFRRTVLVNASASLILVLAFSAAFLSFRHADSEKSFYAVFPEGKVIKSFFSYTLGGHVSGELKRAVLKKETVEKLKKCGVLVYSENTDYPMMKKSIYLDPRNKTKQKPVIKPGQNIVIIFVESLSQFFMQEEVHGLKGITPNLHAMLSESYELTSMYDAHYPTIKGTIATLSSSLYDVDKIKGLGEGFRTPVPCNFLFLSNALQKYGYTSIHVQGGSGIFGGMKDLFEKKQGYDKFYGWESVELQSYAKNKRNSDWGMRDEDIFRYAVKCMDENDNKRPFLLSISTIDMHPPYDAFYKTPNAQGINLLNCLYSTDKGIGVFWDYFKKSRYKDNTVVLVIADHAMSGGNDYEAFLGRYKKDTHPFCDYITCFLYLPGNKAYRGKKNTTFCTNLDVVPTLLDMMNVDCENPFMGLSVFSERQKYPVLISHFRLEDHPYLMAKMPVKGRDLAKKINWTAKDQQELTDFMSNLAVTRGIYPPVVK